MGPVVDSNEAMRCEYISTILHTAVSLLKDLLILPQMTVTGAESSGRVDYAIKKIIDGLFEEIICITEGKQNQPGKGVAQNLMQCKSSCDVSVDFIFQFVHVLTDIIDIDELKHAQKKAKSEYGIDTTDEKIFSGCIFFPVYAILI